MIKAEIHMMALAETMWDAYNESTPKELKAGEWHIPFGEGINYEPSKELYGYQDGGVENESGWLIEGGEEAYYKELDSFKIKIATARCARVSYTVVGEEGKEANYENDIKLHDRLAASGHWSCFEHCARAMNNEEYINNRIHSNQIKKQIGEDHFVDFENGWSGNFRGFVQYRKMFSNENIK